MRRNWLTCIILLAVLGGCASLRANALRPGAAALTAPVLKQKLDLSGMHLRVVPRGPASAPARGAKLDLAQAAPLVRNTAPHPLPAHSASAVQTLLPRLPKLPQGAADVARSTSGLRTVALQSPYSASASAVPAAGNLSLPSTAGTISWAVYQFALPAGENPQSVIINGSLSSSANGGLWVGLSHYSKNDWDLYGPNLLTVGWNTNVPVAIQYLSPNRNFYVAVLTYGGDNATVTSLQLVTASPVTSWFPQSFGFELSLLGLDETQLGFDNVFGSGLQYGTFSWQNSTQDDLRTLLPTFWNSWYQDARSLPPYIQNKRAALATDTKLQDLLFEGISEFPPDQQIAKQTHSENLDPVAPLAKAIADYDTAVGGTPDIVAYTAALAPMSLPNQRAIAPVLYAMIAAYNLRQQAMTDMGINAASLNALYTAGHWHWLSTQNKLDDSVPGGDPIYDIAGPDGVAGTADDTHFMRLFEYYRLFTGAADIASAIDDLKTYIDTNPAWENVSLSVPTPAGEIDISGTNANTHALVTPDGHALIVDLGGNDIYNCHAGGTASSLNPISICLDFGGNDTYNRLDDPNDVDRTTLNSNDDTCQQGAARYGIGILVDFRGTDHYHSVRMSQGSAVMGVGLLADYGQGNDTHDMECLGQGAAYGGVGVLYDAGGNDSYTGIQFCQGFGGIMGAGLLVDQGAGVNSFTATANYDPTMPEYASGQLPPASANASNASFSQGAAFGEPFNTYQKVKTDNHYVVAAGGFGLAFAADGTNTWTAGVFGQGGSVMQGLGIAVGGAGSDTYLARAFGQGAAAVGAASALWDDGGSDDYRCQFSSYTDANGTQYFTGDGGGYNYSVAWLLDRAGDDQYHFVNYAGGVGVADGFGYFLDFAGTDTYALLESGGENLTLGRGYLSPLVKDTDPGINSPSRGVFLDVTGTENYPPVAVNMLSGVDATTKVATPPADNVTWLRFGYPNNFSINYRSNEQGVGRDG